MSDRLVGEDLVLVCSPDYRSSQPRLKRPTDLAGHTLLQQIHRPNWWSDWLVAKGGSTVNAWAGPRFEHFYMIMQAAVAGLGVALLPRLLVREDIAARRLVIPFESPFEGQDAYCLVYPPAKRSDTRLELLRQWLLEEAASERTG